jgi:hypothetical protein
MNILSPWSFCNRSYIFLTNPYIPKFIIISLSFLSLLPHALSLLIPYPLPRSPSKFSFPYPTPSTMSNRGHGHRYRQQIGQCGAIAITICCIPCICVVGSCVLISYASHKIKTYERPSTKRKRQLQRERREMRRRTPRILGPRLEGALTIGRGDGDLDLGYDPDRMPGLGSRILKDEEEVDSESEVSSDSQDTIEGRVERRTDWQTQSSFFKLPLEIMRQIYEEAIGGYVFHIFSLEAYRRMSHTRCKTTRFPEDCAFRRQSKQPGAADEWGNISLLSLLTTCRRMYAFPFTLSPI